jgi:hypothetical protein
MELSYYYDMNTEDNNIGKHIQTSKIWTKHFKKYRILTDILNPGEEDYKLMPSVIPPNKINYEDLVFTLKRNQEKYVSPIVELENYGFFVRGNNIFFKAGKDAGLKSLICDVNMDTLKDKHFSQFQLMDPTVYDSPYSVHAVLFLDILRSDISEQNLIREVMQDARIRRLGPLNMDITFFPEREAIEYKIHKSGEPLYNEIYLKEKGKEDNSYSPSINEELRKNYQESIIKGKNHLVVLLIHSAAKKYGKLRSINGIIPY